MAGANNGPHEAERNRWNVERDESHNPQSLQNLLREVMSIEQAYLIWLEGVCVKCGAEDWVVHSPIIAQYALYFMLLVNW